MSGSSAASLTGLMFVVITLVTGAERTRRTSDGIGTFSTPTVVHFGAALLASALLSVPWDSLVPPAALLGLAGLCGVVYVLRLVRRARQFDSYTPDAEDWSWYSILPFIAYGAMLVGGVLLVVIPVKGLFVLAGGIVLLIFTGIHNAWDIVTFIALRGPDEPPNEPPSST